MHERVPRIGVDEDTAVLIPFSRALHSLGIAGPRQDVAGGERAQDQKDVLVHGVGVRLFYTPSIPTASFTASPRPREPWGYAATAPASVQVRHAQCDADLILLAGERRQRGPIKPDFGPDDSIRPRPDVQRGRGAAELLPGIRRKAHRPAGARAVLIVHVVAPQRQPDPRVDVVRHPAADCPPSGILGWGRQGSVRLLAAVITLQPELRRAQLPPNQCVDAVAIRVVITGLIRAPEPNDPYGGKRIGGDPEPSHQRFAFVVVRNLVPSVYHPELHVDVVVELRFDAHTHRGEVFDVDELVSFRPVLVAGGLDHLQ